MKNVSNELSILTLWVKEVEWNTRVCVCTYTHAHIHTHMYTRTYTFFFIYDHFSYNLLRGVQKSSRPYSLPKIWPNEKPSDFLLEVCPDNVENFSASPRFNGYGMNFARRMRFMLKIISSIFWIMEDWFLFCSIFGNILNKSSSHHLKK